MTKRELIEALAEFPDDMPLFLWDPELVEYYPVEGVYLKAGRNPYQADLPDGAGIISW